MKSPVPKRDRQIELSPSERERERRTETRAQCHKQRKEGLSIKSFSSSINFVFVWDVRDIDSDITQLVQ